MKVKVKLDRDILTKNNTLIPLKVQEEYWTDTVGKQLGGNVTVLDVHGEVGALEVEFEVKRTNELIEELERNTFSVCGVPKHVLEGNHEDE